MRLLSQCMGKVKKEKITYCLKYCTNFLYNVSTIKRKKLFLLTLFLMNFTHCEGIVS